MNQFFIVQQRLRCENINLINYVETDLFQKDFKKLSKKFRTLNDDFIVAKRTAIELLHVQNIDNQSIVTITGYESDAVKIYKLRKFACKALKGKGVMSGVRLIYGYDARINTITFIEIYYKADQENEDRHRIKQFLNETYSG